MGIAWSNNKKTKTRVAAGSGQKSAVAATHIARSLGLLLIEARIEGVEIFAVELILCIAQGFAEALIVYNLALAKEFDNIFDIGIVRKA